MTRLEFNLDLQNSGLVALADSSLQVSKNLLKFIDMVFARRLREHLASAAFKQTAYIVNLDDFLLCQLGNNRPFCAVPSQ